MTATTARAPTRSRSRPTASSRAGWASPRSSIPSTATRAGHPARAAISRRRSRPGGAAAGRAWFIDERGHHRLTIDPALANEAAPSAPTRRVARRAAHGHARRRAALTGAAVLSARELNRATLARQLLLERADGTRRAGGGAVPARGPAGAGAQASVHRPVVARRRLRGRCAAGCAGGARGGARDAHALDAAPVQRRGLRRALRCALQPPPWSRYGCWAAAPRGWIPTAW